MLMAGAAWQPAVAAGIIDDVVTKGRMERNGGMTATMPSVSDSLAYEAYLDSISRKFDMGEVVVTGTRTPKFLKDTPIQTRVINSKDLAKLDATNVADRECSSSWMERGWLARPWMMWTSRASTWTMWSV